jgi:hypothetical protein
MKPITHYKRILKETLKRFQVASPAAGYPLHQDEQLDPFFIIGSGRCGTTLLRKALFAHPKICIPPETYVFSECVQLFRTYRTLPWKVLVFLVLSRLEYHPKFDAFNLSLRPLANELVSVPEDKRSLALILDQFMRYYAQEKGFSCTKWGDKTPRNTWKLDDIHSVFPDAKYIHIIRHGADVVQSYLRTGLHVDLAYSAERWKKTVHLARSFGARHPDQYLEMRYEELVQNPLPFIKQTCEFLAVEYRPEMMEKPEDMTEKMGDVPSYEHFASVREPISTKHIGKWKDSFTEKEIETLRAIIGEDLEELGYSL